MFKKVILTLVVLFVSASLCWAGGWDKKKGLGQTTLTGELVCVGCSLKKLDGANAQCSLYTHHAIGFKAGDGTLWSIVDNAKGHDIIQSHELLENKKATVTGWIYPLAHFIEIDEINVDGVSKAEIRKAAWEEDQLIAKELAGRKVGEAPSSAKGH